MKMALCLRTTPFSHGFTFTRTTAKNTTTAAAAAATAAIIINITAPISLHMRIRFADNYWQMYLH